MHARVCVCGGGAIQITSCAYCYIFFTASNFSLKSFPMIKCNLPSSAPIVWCGIGRCTFYHMFFEVTSNKQYCYSQ